MRFLIVVAALISTLAAAGGALAETAQGPGAPKPAAPKMDETQDAKIKAEYLEAIPYRPCPANVRFPNGQQVCLGLPGNPFYRPYNQPNQ
jgi:hypothetical protein